MLCASGLILLLAYTSTVSPDETLALRLLAAGCVIVTLLLRLQWRYAFYCIALIWIGILVGFLFLYRDHSTISSWFFRIAYPLSFLISAYQIVHKGRPYAITRGNGWETERAQVEWLLESRIDPEGRPFLYIPTGSFWTGYFTYALGNLGEFRTVIIGTGIFSDSTLDLGAGVYGIGSATFSKRPYSDLTGRKFSDSDAAAVRDQALASNGRN